MTKLVNCLPATEDAIGINHHEHTTAARKNSSRLVDDFGNTGEPPSAFADFSRFNPQILMQRHGFQIINFHARGGGDQIMHLVQFAHGIVENGGDNAPVAMSRGTGVLFTQAEATDEAGARVIEGESKVHAVRVIFTAGKAPVLPDRMRFGSVTGCGLF